MVLSTLKNFQTEDTIVFRSKLVNFVLPLPLICVFKKRIEGLQNDKLGCTVGDLLTFIRAYATCLFIASCYHPLLKLFLRSRTCLYIPLWPNLLIVHEYYCRQPLIFAWPRAMKTLACVWWDKQCCLTYWAERADSKKKKCWSTRHALACYK